MKTLGVIGAGSWGTALSIVLAPRFERVRLWAYDPNLASTMRASRQNADYLPDFLLPVNVMPTEDLAEAGSGADIVLMAVPSPFLRGVVRRLVPDLQGTEVFVSATKGLESGTFCRMSVVLEDEIADHCPGPVAILSGPTFAREVARGEPAAVVICSADRELASRIQSQLSGPTFRLYRNDDPAGVEIGAALKNVIAIAAGVVLGLGLGNNTTAALVTRGLAEITRLAVALGGRPETLAGLAGLGDLLLTCTGELSRNRRVGLELAKGRKLTEILNSTKMISEGVETTYAAVALARRCGIEMPITEQMYLILHEGKSPEDGSEP